MFSLALYDKIKTNTTIGGIPVTWGYGEVPDATTGVYIIQYNLDDNTDRQLLCDDYNDSGLAFVQWNIYSEDAAASDRIAHELEVILDGYWASNLNLTYSGNSYTIKIREHNSSPSAQVIENDLAISVLTNTFTYKKGE